ncbi:MAG: Coenzyme F420 hydrogenase/dehydrogenase, beta subunit C-terminal domain [Firmicutes bacterium]|nr:Coenzyme F420 hydrogenase/dehydrogenase, beta subunit C-terminal domain [Bacillota bacterium]
MSNKLAFHDLYSDVIGQGLCTACGICAGVCPTKVIDMDYSNQEAEPILTGKCKECGICYKVCPGKDIPLKDLDLKFLGQERDFISDEIGIYKGCYKGWAKDKHIQNVSSSGGMVSALLIYAMENDIIDGALLVGWDKEKPYRAKPIIAKTPEDVLNACRWTAEAIPVNELLHDAVMKEKLQRIAVVGMPCHIHGIRKLQASGVPSKIAKSIKFTIGLFCAATYYFEGIKHLIGEFSDVRSLDDIETLDYRGGSAPGALMVTTKDKRIHSVASKHDYTWHFLGPATYKRDRCLMCVDFSAELADISCGDIFQPVIPGRKHVVATITRTEIGEELVKGAAGKGYIEYSDHDPSMISCSGMGWESKKHAGMYRLMERKRHNWPAPDYQYPLGQNVKKRKLTFPK